MKIRSGKLIDRYLDWRDRVWLTIQTPKGTLIHARVRDEDVEEAVRIWGGTPVRYVYRGGRPFYLSYEEFVAHVAGTL